LTLLHFPFLHFRFLLGPYDPFKPRVLANELQRYFISKYTMAIPFAAATAALPDFTFTNTTVDEAIRKTGESLKEMLLNGNLGISMRIMAGIANGPLSGGDPHCVTALQYLVS
jgi:hypothetical protein